MKKIQKAIQAPLKVRAKAKMGKAWQSTKDIGSAGLKKVKSVGTNVKSMRDARKLSKATKLDTIAKINSKKVGSLSPQKAGSRPGRVWAP